MKYHRRKKLNESLTKKEGPLSLKGTYYPYLNAYIYLVVFFRNEGSEGIQLMCWINVKSSAP